MPISRQFHYHPTWVSKRNYKSLKHESEQRSENSIPIQYLLSHKSNAGYSFKVNAQRFEGGSAIHMNTHDSKPIAVDQNISSKTSAKSIKIRVDK